MGKRYAILIIDDEPIIINALKIQLQRHLDQEIEIEYALSAQEALSIMKELKDTEVPLVICDYQMPGIKGDQLIIELHKNYPDTLSILLTGQIDVKGMGNIVNEGRIFRYIPKPWDEMDFILTIREALRLYKMTALVKVQHKQILDYSFVNAHTVRGPLARILGLISIIKKAPETLFKDNLLDKLENAAAELDQVIRNLTKTLEENE